MMDHKKDIDWDAFMRKCMNEAPTPDDGRYIVPKTKKETVIDSIRMTMRKEDIMTFVSGLHNIQMGMIETVVISKEKQGFPEATAVINHIMELE
jgi:hypothetical protein